MERLTIRQAIAEDKTYLFRWLFDKDVLKWFPMCDRREIDDAVNILMSYIRYGVVLTSTYDDIPCAISTLYLSPYKKIAHQCLFVIIVDAKYRGRGIGTKLIKEMIHLAKEKFQIEILHLEVYEENPAISLYKRLGFEQYGFQKRFLKEEGRYRGKILMQKRLI